MIKYIPVFIILCQQIVFFNLSAQTNQNIDLAKVEQVLIEEGFRNIRVKNHNTDLYVGLENNVYRFEPDAISKAISLILPHAQQHRNIILIIERLQVPVISINVPVQKAIEYTTKQLAEIDFINSLKINYAKPEEIKIIATEKRLNRNTFDLDLILEPRIGFQLGNYDYPFRYQIRLLPLLETSLWKGQRTAFQFSVPVYSHHVDTNKYIRPHIISFEQNFRLGNGLFSRLTFGWYTEKRYGFDFEMEKYLFNGRLMLRGNLGYTGYILYAKKNAFGLFDNTYSRPTIEYDSPNYLQYFANIEYRIPKYDLALNVGYGKFLYENHAYTVDFYRNFNEYILGFQAFFSETGHNFGFHISIPLWPAKNLKNKNIRIKPSKYINYSYLATQDYVNTYDTGINRNEVFRELNPVYLKNYIAKNLLLIYIKKENNY